MTETNGTLQVARQHLIERALIWAALIFLLLMLTMVLTLVSVVLWAAPQPILDVIKPMIEGRVISRTICLFLIVPAVSGLTLLDKVSGDTAAAILSAIAGYILGSSSAAA